jgi:hypothetical protein
MKTSNLNKILKQLKNWWFAIVGFAFIILDQGFEVLSPFLLEIGVGDKWIKVLKLLIGIYGIYKLKMSLPTQNNEKLKKIINDRVLLQEGDPTPGKGF